MPSNAEFLMPLPSFVVAAAFKRGEGADQRALQIFEQFEIWESHCQGTDKADRAPSSATNAAPLGPDRSYIPLALGDAESKAGQLPASVPDP